MNIEALKKQLIIDEGMKLQIYLDHLGNPTFGIGHLLTKKDVEWQSWQNLPKGGKITVSEQRVYEVFAKDIQSVIVDCKFVFEQFENFLEEVQQIIANMMFNLGLNRFAKFSNFISAIKNRNYKKAAREMKDSTWCKQVGNRALRLVLRMENLANDALCNDLCSTVK